MLIIVLVDRFHRLSMSNKSFSQTSVNVQWTVHLSSAYPWFIINFMTYHLVASWIDPDFSDSSIRLITSHILLVLFLLISTPLVLPDIATGTALLLFPAAQRVYLALPTRANLSIKPDGPHASLTHAAFWAACSRDTQTHNIFQQGTSWHAVVSTHSQQDWLMKRICSPPLSYYTVAIVRQQVYSSAKCSTGAE